MKNLRRLRKLVGLTQLGLCRESGVGRTRISLAESGHVALKEREIAAIRRALLRQMRKRTAQLQHVLGSAEDLRPTA